MAPAEGGAARRRHAAAPPGASWPPGSWLRRCTAKAARCHPPLLQHGPTRAAAVETHSSPAGLACRPVPSPRGWQARLRPRPRGELPVPATGAPAPPAPPGPRKGRSCCPGDAARPPEGRAARNRARSRHCLRAQAAPRPGTGARSPRLPSVHAPSAGGGTLRRAHHRGARGAPASSPRPGALPLRRHRDPRSPRGSPAAPQSARPRPRRRRGAPHPRRQPPGRRAPHALCASRPGSAPRP
mmetsp:Transcript_52017/g.166599  ORF Transcript_52017/g.166599 Transcript_52017/m.166599 type:complete len:241 (-) Transcript_52017:1847-2569(-)